MPQIDIDGTNSKISADTIGGQSGTTVTVQSGHNLAGSGSGLTALNASNISTGTVADARISTLTASKLTGNLPAISGASLTSLPVSTYASAAGAGHTGISTNQSIATTTLTKISFTHELYDDDSNFDLANERYVAPAAGKYFVSFSVGMQTGFGASQRGIAHLYKNGAAAFSPLNQIFAENNTSTTSAINVSNAVVVPLAQNDYLEVFFMHFKGSTQTLDGGKCWLQVYRLS